MTTRHFAPVAEYFRAAQQALAGEFKMGVYGDGYICRRLHTDGLADYRWLAAGKDWPGSANYEDWDIDQSLAEGTLCGLGTEAYEPCTAKQTGPWCFCVEAHVAPPKPESLPLLRRGNTGEYVLVLQGLLNEWLSARGAAIDEDGIFSGAASRVSVPF